MGGQALEPPAGSPFTKREWLVIRHMAEGLSREEMVVAIGRSNSTLRNQIVRARQRVGVHTDEGLIAECFSRGWLLTRPELEEKATQEDEGPITPAQRYFLDAFTRRILHWRDEPVRSFAAQEMDWLVGSLAREQDVPRPPGSLQQPKLMTRTLPRDLLPGLGPA